MSSDETGIRRWLGEAGARATDHQIGDISDILAGASKRFPGEPSLITAATRAGASITLGDERLTVYAARYARALREEGLAKAALEGAIYAARLHHEDPYAIARQLGLEPDLVHRILNSW
jgi:hypothetical protein